MKAPVALLWINSSIEYWIDLERSKIVDLFIGAIVGSYWGDLQRSSVQTHQNFRCGDVEMLAAEMSEMPKGAISQN